MGTPLEFEQLKCNWSRVLAGRGLHALASPSLDQRTLLLTCLAVNEVFVVLYSEFRNCGC
jgi:hypothetical protein